MFKRSISRSCSNLALLLLTLGCAYGTTLVGTINGPNAAGVNGYLYMALSQQGALASQCGAPVQVVPTTRARFQLVNGIITGANFIYGNDCLLPQGTYYNIQVIDANGNTLMTERWVISGATVDVGTIVSVSITGTTSVLGQPGVVLTVPTADQVVTQPGNTFTKFNNVEVTQESRMGGTFNCRIGVGCTFTNTTTFAGGLNTSTNSSSNVYIGTGNLFTRAFSGADITCTGIKDGWVGVRIDKQEQQWCIGDTVVKVPMNRSAMTDGCAQWNNNILGSTGIPCGTGTGGGGSSGAVTSVFGRTGAVVGQTGDYSAAMVTNAIASNQLYPNPDWIPSYAFGKLSGVPGFITTLNGATQPTQTFAASSSSCSDFTITTATGVHTWCIPTASATARGLVTTALYTAWNNKQNALGFTPENTANKGIAGGYPSLDAGGRVPQSQLPATAAGMQTLNGLSTQTQDFTVSNDTNIGLVVSSAVQTHNFRATWIGTLAGSRMALFQGDFGAGGVAGAVPAPAAGDTTAGKFLSANGGWAVPAGTANTVPTSRQINSGNGLTGGGDLSANRTLSVVDDTTTQRIRTMLGGVVIGTRPAINFIQGAGSSLSVNDNSTNNRIDITITATGTGAISSVFGRTGAIVAASGDYSAAQITGLAPSATTDTTNASNINTGILPAGRLPTPTATTLGGVQSKAVAVSTYVTGIGPDGAVLTSGIGAASVTGLAPSATVDTTNASNINTGVLAGNRMANFSGDAGSGGQIGAVPAPATGDGAAGKFLSASGIWKVPAGGNATLPYRNYVIYSLNFANPIAAVNAEVPIISGGYQNGVRNIPAGALKAGDTLRIRGKFVLKDSATTNVSSSINVLCGTTRLFYIDFAVAEMANRGGYSQVTLDATVYLTSATTHLTYGSFTIGSFTGTTAAISRVPGGGSAFDWSTTACNIDATSFWGTGATSTQTTQIQYLYAEVITPATSVATAEAAALATVTIPFQFNNSGKVLTAGMTSSFIMDQSCNVKSWKFAADKTGSVSVDVLRGKASVPSTKDLSIVGSGVKPGINRGDLVLKGSISGWKSTELEENDVLAVNVLSASSITRGTLTLQCER
jgi:hypothetical protein